MTATTGSKRTLEEISKGITIRSFAGQNDFLSNISPASVLFEGELYPSVEHCLQAAKSTDVGFRAAVRAAPDGLAAKRVGRSVKVPKDWNEKVALQLMPQLLRDKFRRNKKLRARLSETMDAQLLYENDHNDTFWGRCGAKGGMNHLGSLLEAARLEIKRGLDLELWVRTSFRCFGPKKPKLRVNVEKNGAVVERLELEFKAFYIVGKLPLCDVQMLHPSISRQHAVLVLEPASAGVGVTVSVVDLASSYGTKVDGVALPPLQGTPVPPGGRVVFGLSSRTYICFADDEDAERERREKARELELLLDPKKAAEEKRRSATRQIFVGNLPFSASEKDVSAVFEDCGRVLRCRVPTDRETGKPRGFAFVEFETPEAVEQAITKNGVATLEGRELSVREAEQKPRKP